MSRTTKIILSITAAVLVFCGLACIATLLLIPRFTRNLISTEPGQAQNVGKQIADYTVPPGYTETGMDMFIEKVVMLQPEDHLGPSIMIMQISTPNTSQEQAEEETRSVFERSFSQGTATYRHVEDRNVTIKGQPTVLSVSESDVGNVTIRQATGTFKGKGGIAVIMISGDAEGWDWKLVEDFCASIH